MSQPPGGEALPVMTVLGTRPEIIRLSRTLARLDDTFSHTLVHTGQNHDYELSQVFFDELGLRRPDYHLGVDTSSLGTVLGGILTAVEPVFLEVRPHALLILGDTNSSIAAIMAKRLQIPVYHMEAGNRSFDLNVPEEVNRHLIDHVADFNLVYTEHARRNLISEGLSSRQIILTGSPMPEVLAYYEDAIGASPILGDLGLDPDGYLLVSAHREETVDDPRRLTELVGTLSDVQRAFARPLLVSVHPRTRQRLQSLGIREGEEVRFHKPFGFLDYVQLQRQAFCVLSDSGTISEESAILGFPAVTFRDAIERPEALEAGTIITTGLDSSAVIAGIRQVVTQRQTAVPFETPTEYQILNFSQRVVNVVRSTAHVYHRWLGVRPRSPVWTDAQATAGPVRKSAGADGLLLDNRRS